MIRIVIVARTAARAQTVARLLADDERFDILDARDSGVDDFPDPAACDVVVAVGLSVEQIPRWASRIVVVSDALAPRTSFGSQVHAWLSSGSSATELSAAVYAAACGHPCRARSRAYIAADPQSVVNQFVISSSPRSQTPQVRPK